MICPVCKGSGNILTFNPMEYWPCPCCHGQGVRISGIQPAKIPCKGFNTQVSARKTRGIR